MSLNIYAGWSSFFQKHLKHFTDQLKHLCRWDIKGDASMGSATNAILGCTMIW